MADWFLYIIRCGDGTLYTGITKDIQRRLAEHRGRDGGNKGAKYLRSRGPLKLVYAKKAGTRSQALAMEYRIKRMKKREKEKIISNSRFFPNTYFPPTRSRRSAG